MLLLLFARLAMESSLRRRDSDDATDPEERGFHSSSSSRAYREPISSGPALARCRVSVVRDTSSRTSISSLGDMTPNERACIVSLRYQGK